MTPYLSFLLAPFIELLQDIDNQEEDSFGPAQLCTVQTLTKSMNVDEGGPYTFHGAHAPADVPISFNCPLSTHIAFWRDDRLQQVTPVLVALIARAAVGDDDTPPIGSSSSGGGREAVSAGLVELCGAATDDDLLKRLNLDLLMHTRADDARVRIFALQCARELWTAHGSKLMGACSPSGESCVSV